MKGLIEKIGNLFGRKPEPEPEPYNPPVVNAKRMAAVAAARRAAARQNAANDAEVVPTDEQPEPAYGHNVPIEDGGPGKNVLARSRYIREDTGTHETLKIVDESIFDVAEENEAFDPYNTGRFDRAKSWDKLTRK